MGFPFGCQQSVVSGERRTVGVRRFFPMVAIHPRVEADRLGIPIGGSRGTGYNNGGEKSAAAEDKRRNLRSRYALKLAQKRVRRSTPFLMISSLVA